MRKFRSAAAAILTVLLCSLTIVTAEISVGTKEHPVGLLVATSGGDDPTPVPWGRVRDALSLEHLLNANVPGNEYGPASFAIDPLAEQPVVVWAQWDGSDFEIRLSRWDGTGWTPAMTLTNNDIDDMDPAIAFTAAGDRLVSWWRSESDRQVWFLEKPAGAGWHAAERVTQRPHTGRLPGITEVSGEILTAYQAKDGELTKVTVSARSDGWDPLVIASVSYQGPGNDGAIFVRIHSRQGQIWVDWIDGPGVMGYSVRDPQTGIWSAPSRESYSWDTLAGESEYWERESARVRIRLQILH